LKKYRFVFSPEILLGFSSPSEDRNSGFGESSGNLILGRVDVASGPVNLKNS
jgi:hypothetical protein